MEALRRGYDTPEIRAAAAKMQEAQAALKARRDSISRAGGKSFGRVRMLPNGVVEYAKKGWEPPPELDGYQRDPGNAWRFIPIWPPCRKRIQTTSMKSCGAMSVLTVCANDQCEHKQKQVTYAICAACPLRVTS